MSGIYVIAEEIGRCYHQGTTEIKALVSASCSVKAGDRIALMGASGSGKSTLLHLFGALDQPTAGRIELTFRLWENGLVKGWSFFTRLLEPICKKTFRSGYRIIGPAAKTGGSRNGIGGFGVIVRHFNRYF
jgi:ABC-type oligopeptide transport system ATPase subunit